MSNRPVVSHPFVVEDHRPLSLSKLWDFQRQLYVGQGIRAWREAGVPHYIATNPFTARTFARVTLAHLRSVLSNAGAARRKGARILELGAGTGRFAHHFLEQFLAMWRDAELEDVPVTYIMTDVAARNVDFWREHPAFAKCIERGQLTFATCDAEDPADVQRLLETTAPGQHGGPLVVFANYVFDGLRQDLFYCDQGRLFEGLVALKAARPEVDPTNPLATIAIEVARRALDHAPSEDPAWNRILEGYRLRGGAGAVLFPASAMRCLDRLRALSPDSLLVLAADEGSPRLDEVTSGELRLLDNGSVPLPEFPVNFHALGEYVTACGGQPIFASHQVGGLCLAAFVWDGAGRDCVATRQAFHDAMDLFGPDEFFLVMKSLERTGSLLTCPEMLAYLRWSAWDVKVLHVLLPHLRERLAAASPTEIAAWSDAMERAWSLYYHLGGDEGDVAFGIGATLARVGQWKGALSFFERSRALWGDDGNTLYNLGVCHARLGDRRAALACVDSLLASTPGHDRALHLRREIMASAG